MMISILSSAKWKCRESLLTRGSEKIPNIHKLGEGQNERGSKFEKRLKMVIKQRKEQEQVVLQIDQKYIHKVFSVQIGLA